MKNFFLVSFSFLVLMVASSTLLSQHAPVWTQVIHAFPDSAYVSPVRTMNDINNNIYVLSTYHKQISPGIIENKIYLNKYSQDGVLAWNLIFDNNGSGSPRGFDMAVDGGGNCYIAGGLMAPSSYSPLLLKVNTSGSVAWQRDSTGTFNTGNYSQVILKNNMLFVNDNVGIAKFDLNGNEQWSTGLPAGRMAVDNSGQVIVSVYFGNPTTIVRLDNAGVINFSDVTIQANRIATDMDNNFYLFTDFPSYELVKYDSAGSQQWSKNNFPAPPPFGDIGYEVLTDYNNDVIVLGMADSMYKFTSSGTPIWAKSMDSLDGYLLAAKITFNNFLAIAGTVPSLNGYDIQVDLFDLNGNNTWKGKYNSNNTQEFSVDLTIDNSGIYVLEDSISNTLLAKFDSPFNSSVIDYSLICVDSVWYDPNNPIYINASVFNGNVNGLNYPSVQIVSPSGDTIGNKINWVNFFAHLGNSYLIYSDTITDSSITDWTGYTFLISEGFGDTTVVINWCNPTGITEIEKSEILIYPNPANDLLHLKNNLKGNEFLVEIFNSFGSKILNRKFPADPNIQLDIKGFADGIYFIRLISGNKLIRGKFVKL